MAKLSKKAIESAVNGAVVGFRIPMMSIPAIGNALRAAIMEGKSAEELKAIVGNYPGVEVA